ncbi:hypothetical protein ACQPZZ_09495 [Microbispora sp. CA-135349]|uniref:aromatic-ring hydroxylase C-terminal domain-containing protein n=1 Tax=Microbispora sp. CA-135349 TaxID=3239953 RepID=UPI003D92835A
MPARAHRTTCGSDAVLIRPDGPVAWVTRAGERPDLDALRTALTTWLGPVGTQVAQRDHRPTLWRTSTLDQCVTLPGRLIRAVLLSSPPDRVRRARRDDPGRAGGVQRATCRAVIGGRLGDHR